MADIGFSLSHFLVVRWTLRLRLLIYMPDCLGDHLPFVVMQEEFQTLDYSQHGDYLSPPGGSSPGLDEARAAQPTADTLSRAASAVRSAAATNGAAAPAPATAAPGQLPPVHPPSLNTVRRTSSSGGQVGSAGASPSGFSASGPMRFSSTAGKVCTPVLLAKLLQVDCLCDHLA